MQLRHNRPPLSGIFAVEVHGAAESSPQRVTRGVASLGVRPTVHEYGKPVLEVYLFDFNQEIYGRHLRMDFLHKLRDEEKYSDLDTLTRQIERDVENAKNYFLTLHPVQAHSKQSVA
jgi:riboflavin kinase/FMN adenylyltransferase